MVDNQDVEFNKCVQKFCLQQGEVKEKCRSSDIDEDELLHD